MPDRTDTLIEQIQARAEDARRIAEAADAKGWTVEDRQTVARLLEEAQPLKAELDVARDGGELRRSLKALADEVGPRRDNGGASSSRSRGRSGSSLGAAFVASDEYKSLRKHFPDGRIPDQARVAMTPVPFRSLTGKATQEPEAGSPNPGGGTGEGALVSITGDDNAGGHGYLVPAQFDGLVDTLGRPEVHMRDLISRRTTTSDLVEYVVQDTRANAADWVPEATDLDPAAFPSGETGIKPMGGFTFRKKSSPVDTIAEWIPITKRAVMDAGQLRGLIDQELRGDLVDGEERAFLYGGGDNGEIEGLDETEGTLEQDFDTDLFVTTRKARSLVRFVGRATPTAFLMNIEDDEAIDLARDGMERFFGNGPFSMGPNTLWGLPRIASEYVREGEAWVADWRRAVVWDRQQASISVSDSHADFFIRNLLAVLGEQREAFGVIRPAAFVRINTA